MDRKDLAKDKRKESRLFLQGRFPVLDSVKWSDYPAATDGAHCERQIDHFPSVSCASNRSASRAD